MSPTKKQIDGSQDSLPGISAPQYLERGFVPTPAEVTRALFHAVPPPPGRCLEPYAGNGAIITAACEVMAYSTVPGDWTAVEIRAEEAPELEALQLEQVIIGDFSTVLADGIEREVIISNPDYADLPLAVARCFEVRNWQYIAMLMPIEEMAGVARSKWFKARTPTALVPISWRPFPNCRGVAWYVWERAARPLSIYIV